MDRNYQLIEQHILEFGTNVSIINSNCNTLNFAHNFENTSGTIPVKKASKYKITIWLVVAICILPIALIWGYSQILGILGMPLSLINTILGSVISAIITSITSLSIVKKK